MNKTSELIKKIHALTSELNPALVSIIQDSESRFVKLGEDLQSVYNDADKLKHMAVDSANIIGEGSEDAGTFLSDLRNFTNDSMKELDTFRNNVAETFPRFESCIKNIYKLHDMCPDIIKIAKTLNIVALNISVESSRTKTSEEMFNIFVKEIRELAKRVHNIAHMIKEDSAVSGSERDDDFNGILKRMDHIDNMADEAGETVSENIKSIDKAVSLSFHTLQKSEEHSNRISSLVGEVVIAIQFHDIVRQQIEHVTEAFHDLKQLIGERDTSTSYREEGLDILNKAGSITQLQYMQMVQIHSEIEEAHKKITIAFKEIGKEAADLVAGIGSLGSGNIEVGNQQSALDLLLSDFKKLEVITTNGEKLSKRISKAMRQTVETASNISGHLSSMQEIGMDLHIKSVNALIMSRKLGHEGLALSVLAQNVTDVSRGSDHFVNEVIGILKKMQETAFELQELSSQKDIGKAGGGRLITERVEHITGIYDRFIKKTEDALLHSMDLKERLFMVGSSLAFLDQMKSRIKECIEEMNGLVKELSPYMENDRNEDNLNILKDRYTMEVERNIHQMSMETDDNISDNNAPDINFEGLGDNVELF